MPANRAEALKLPDQLLVRYFRGDELQSIHNVCAQDKGQRFLVRLQLSGGEIREDHWRDLGGGLGFVPDAASD